jgi:hypothetical protein
MLKCAHTGRKIADPKDALMIHNIKRGTKVIIDQRTIETYLPRMRPLRSEAHPDGLHQRVNVHGVSLSPSGMAQLGDFRISVELGAIGLYFPAVFKKLCYGKPE